MENVLDEIKEDYPNLKVHKYEVWYNAENRNYMNEAATILDTKVTGVPFTVIGTKVFKGYSSLLQKENLNTQSKYTLK